MILQQIGLLKAESDLNLFQRRLESPHPPHAVCHPIAIGSREGGNPLNTCNPIAIGSRKSCKLHYPL
jgi:hypothetical protein